MSVHAASDNGFHRSGVGLENVAELAKGLVGGDARNFGCCSGNNSNISAGVGTEEEDIVVVQGAEVS